MNNDRRKKLKQAVKMINEARDVVDGVMDEEQMAFDNLPEGLQEAEKGSEMEDNVSELESITEAIDEVVERIEEFY